jgi:hypothetical protein
MTVISERIERATGIPNSPLMSRRYDLFSVTTFSALLSVVEVAAALLLGISVWTLGDALRSR